MPIDIFEGRNAVADGVIAVAERATRDGTGEIVNVRTVEALRADHLGPVVVEIPLKSGFGKRFAGIDASDATADFVVSRSLYEKIAYREGTEGIVAVMRARQMRLEDLQPSPAPLILVLEGVEKPGNLGAVLRTADAAGVDAVLVCDPLTDLYNPNLIRASLGALFSVPTVACTSEEAFAWLSSRGIAVLTAQLQDSVLYYETDMVRSTALVFGTEDKGLSDFWRNRADAHIRIPMAGAMDSLNVSVSAAILAFEAVRQRKQQNTSL